MKLTLTQQEAELVLKEHYRVHEVAIETQPPASQKINTFSTKSWAEILEGFIYLLDETRAFVQKEKGLKIPCIRILRHFFAFNGYNLSLASAKNVLESSVLDLRTRLREAKNIDDLNQICAKLV